MFGDRTLRAILYRGVLCFVTFTLLNSISLKLIFVNIVISYFTKLSCSAGVRVAGLLFCQSDERGAFVYVDGFARATAGADG